MVDPIRALSLFAGVGGLDIGLKIAIPNLRVCGYVEREAYAAAVLLARMEEQALEPAPVFCGDICNFDARPLAGSVDIVAGGFPCQDISAAGKGEGIVPGNRSGLWFEYERIIRELGPDLKYVFVENVRALISQARKEKGLDVVLAGLARLGFDAEWGVLPARAVGAPHKRERVFILAYRPGERRGEGRIQAGGEPVQRPGWTGPELAHAAQRGFRIDGRAPGQPGHTEQRDQGMADAGGGQFPQSGRGSRGRTGPGPTGPGSDPLEHALRGTRGPEQQLQPDGQTGQPRRAGNPAGVADAAGGGGGPGFGFGFGSSPGQRGEPRAQGLGRTSGVADAACVGEREPRHQNLHAGRPKEGRGSERESSGVVDPNLAGFPQRPIAHVERGVLRQEGYPLGAADHIGAFPPGPGEVDQWAQLLATHPYLAPAIEPDVRGAPHGLAVVVDDCRADRLRACGNGVVALQAAAAVVELACRANVNLCDALFLVQSE